jgi:hypothetical protein
MQKVAEIYQANTGVALDAQQLQKAFDAAKTIVQKDTRDAVIQKLVDEGKITQTQADALKAWLDARPQMMSDAFKQWLQSRPDIPGLFGSNNSTKLMPFGGMPRGFGGMGRGMMRGLHNRLPGTNN